MSVFGFGSFDIDHPGCTVTAFDSRGDVAFQATSLHIGAPSGEPFRLTLVFRQGGSSVVVFDNVAVSTANDQETILPVNVPVGPSVAFDLTLRHDVTEDFFGPPVGSAGFALVGP